jgi:hypothetical protein
MLQAISLSEQWAVVCANIDAPAASSSLVPSRCPDQQVKCRGVRPQLVSPALMNLHSGYGTCRGMCK